MVKGKSAGSSTDKPNKPKKGRNYKKTPWYQCQCSGSSQIPIQDDLNYHQLLSLYNLDWRKGRTVLIIYDTESKKEKVKVLNTKLRLDFSTSITQLPNGELFCYGGNYEPGVTMIIDRNYRIKMLPSGTPCSISSSLYFDNNIYCFGGYATVSHNSLNISRKFDLKNNRWSDLALLPEGYGHCNSVIFNGNILVSRAYCENLWLYSIEIDSFSIIPYDFKPDIRRFLINVERLYLIEIDDGGLIYESQDEYHWKPISKSGKFGQGYQIYCLYNKEKIYISTKDKYYQFDLKKKVVSKIK